jgi:hypothetical protein
VRDHEASWLAATLDCDGSIVIKKRRDGGPRFRLVVYNTVRAFVERAASLMESTVFTNGHPNSISKTPKPMHSTECASHERVLEILEAIEPFLIVKKDKARIAIDSIKSHDWGKWSDEAKRKHSGRMVEQLSRPATKRKMREKALARWQDPEFRAKWQEARHGNKKA